MTCSLRIIQGRLAEVVGEARRMNGNDTSVDHDPKKRTFGFYRAARRVLSSPDGFLCRLNSLRLKCHNSFTERGFEVSEIFTDQAEVRLELLRVFYAVLPHFLNVWVLHVSSPRKASGDTISGHS